MHLLVAATNNKHKIEEICQALGDRLAIRTLNEIGCYDDLPETQNSLEGNSLQKARYVFEHYHLPCFADDTGLEVESLNGEPGVYSARYAGEQRNSNDNIDLLLQKLEGRTNRKARFRTIVTLVEVSGVITFEGIVKGEIIRERRGSSGFGYDPVFLPDGSGKTLAEMTLEEKNEISHRGVAIRKLADYLLEKYGDSRPSL
jgi:XTP/dITP diphosphohydrolase